MKDNEKGLRSAQESVMIAAACKAVDDGRVNDVLALMERVEHFWPQGLSAVLAVFCTHPTKYQTAQAFALFRRQLTLCSNPNALVHVALWVRNPKRSFFLPKSLQELIDQRQRELDPNWNGVWENPGLKGIVDWRRLSPNNVYDPETCLMAASQRKDWNPWLMRYLSLGGDPDNPKYLKLRVTRAFTIGLTASPGAKKSLRRYCEVEEPVRLRKLLRSITPTEKPYGAFYPNRGLSHFALLVYCSCEKIEHNAEDWAHIARSAMYLGNDTIERIAQRGLASVERTPPMQRVLDELTIRHGQMRVTGSAKGDIGAISNPIWQSVYKLLPIDANARRILISYSRLETENFE